MKAKIPMGKRGGSRREAAALRIGARVWWEGARWEVVEWAGPVVTLMSLDAPELPRGVLYRWLVGAADFAVLDEADEPRPLVKVSRPGALEGLSPKQRKEAQRWHERMVEVDTGIAPGAFVARPGFDPEATTLGQRCAAMSARLADVGIQVSAYTLAAKRRCWKAAGENAVVLLPKKRSPVPGGHTDQRVLEAMREVVCRYARRSDVTIDTVREQVTLLLKSRYAHEMKDRVQEKALLIPRSTFYTRMEDTGLSEQLREPTRKRAARAVKPALPHGAGGGRPLRPGEVTQIDTTPLRIVARGDDGKPVGAEMTTLVDVAGRSMCGLMITPRITKDRKGEGHSGGRATRAVDLTLLLAQCYAPWPVMPGWEPLAAAAVSSLPFSSLQAADPRFTEATAARPVIHPEMIIFDQGSPYVSDHFFEVCDRRRIAMRPARKGTPTDKPLVERFFITLADRFSQHVTHGWQGRSHHTRGRGVERMPLYTIDELQQMAQEWVALEYQQTPHKGLRDPHLPKVVLSPSDMYAVQVARSGYRPLPLSPAENRWFLLPAWVKPGENGFTIDYRTYQPTREDLRHYQEVLSRGSSGLPGKNGCWECRYNPYRPERAWLYDHVRKAWVEMDFTRRHLLNHPWTADMWQEAREAHVGAGGDVRGEDAIALALERRRSRTRKPPPPRRGPDRPFQGLPLEVDEPEARDRYADLAPVDLSTITPYPSLPISPAAQPPSTLPSPAPPAQAPTEPAASDPPRTLEALFAPEAQPATAAEGEAGVLSGVLEADVSDFVEEFPEPDQPQDIDVWEADAWEEEPDEQS